MLYYPDMIFYAGPDLDRRKSVKGVLRTFRREKGRELGLHESIRLTPKKAGGTCREIRKHPNGGTVEIRYTPPKSRKGKRRGPSFLPGPPDGTPPLLGW